MVSVKTSGLVALALAGLVVAGLVATHMPYISYFHVSPTVYRGSNFGSVSLGVSPGNVSFNSSNNTYVAVYAKPVGSNADWVQVCAWPPQSITKNSTNFGCSPYIPLGVSPGNYTVRATVHVNSEYGCSPIGYTPEVRDGCGDIEDRYAKVV